MSAAKATTKTSTRSKASGAARKAATGAAKSAAKGAGKAAAKGATKASSSAVAAGSDRIGRGTRWTEQQVRLLMDTVAKSDTAKEAFELVARELNKSAGTVAQKYYNLQKASGSGRSSSSAKRGRPKGSTSAARSGTRSATSTASHGLPTATQLRVLTVDELVGLASRVKDEVDRRREELDAAARALKA